MPENLSELFKKGEQETLTGEFEKACAIYEEILRTCEGTEDQLSTARARMLLADVETLRGRFAEAVPHYMKAFKVFSAVNDLAGLANTFRGLGYIHWRKGDYSMAEEYLRNGLERAMASGDREVQGRVLIDLGNVTASMGRLEEAEWLYKQAIDVLEGTGAKFEQDRALMNLGDIYLTRGDVRKAAYTWDIAINKCRARTDVSNLGWALLNHSEAMALLGELSSVPKELEEARGIMVATDDRVGLAATKRVMAQWATAKGDWETAEREFESALADYQEMGLAERQATVHRLFAEMLAKKGDKARAGKQLAKAEETFRDIGNEREVEMTKAMADRLAQQGLL